MNLTKIRDFVIIFVGVNVYLHLNFPEYADWVSNNRKESFEFISSIFSSVYTFVCSFDYTGLAIMLIAATIYVLASLTMKRVASFMFKTFSQARQE